MKTNKSAGILVLLLSFFLLLSTTGFGQQTAAEVQLGNIEAPSSKFKKVTADEVLSNPVLKCKYDNCAVTSFVVSVEFTDPKSRDRFFGPFDVTGNKLPEKVLDLIKEFKTYHFRLYIESVYIKNEGKIKLANGVYLKNNS